MPPTPSPHPLGYPPLRWWSQTWRLVVILAVGVASFGLTLYDVSDGFERVLTDRQGLLTLLDLAVGLACLGLVSLRRRRPLLVVLLLTAGTAVSSLAAGAHVLGVVSLATRRRWQDVPAVIVSGLVAAEVYQRLWPSPDPLGGWETLAFGSLSFAVFMAVGWYVGARRDLLVSLRERAATLEREQAVRLDAARAHERSAIAREMHDVLAHRISLVAMHAGALTYRTDLDDDRRTEVARIIESNAHLALDDLRDVLGVLRQPGGAPGAAADAAALSGAQTGAGSGRIAPPQPTLADVPRLVDESREAGLHVDLANRVHGTPPDTLGRHAYRIVQESLTNARKHAPGLPVTLRLTGRPGAGLHVEIANPTPPVGAARLPGAGVGLAGMSERAALAGGRLAHGPTDDGRFVVRADLPWTDLESP